MMAEANEPSRKKTKKKPQNFSHSLKLLPQDSGVDNVKTASSRKVVTLDAENCFRPAGMPQVNGGHPWCIPGEDSSSESFTHMNINLGVNNNPSSETSCDFFRSAILDEVLNQKKMALLQSPEVAKFLRELQLKKRTEK